MAEGLRRNCEEQDVCCGVHSPRPPSDEGRHRPGKLRASPYIQRSIRWPTVSHRNPLLGDQVASMLYEELVTRTV
jgi:hypothetical protein